MKFCCVILVWIFLIIPQSLIAEEACSSGRVFHNEHNGDMEKGKDSQAIQKEAPSKKPLCRTKFLRKKNTIHIIEKSTGRKIDYIRFGKNKMKKTITSPDGLWTVFIYQLHDTDEYRALPVHLGICEIMEPILIPMMPESAIFEDIFVTFRFPDGQTKRSIMRGKCI